MAKTPAVMVRTPAAYAAYAWLDKPDSGQQYSDDKFKVTAVFDKDTDLSDIEKTLITEARKKWPGIKPADLKLPFIDGDDKGKDEFAGKVLLTMKSKFRPQRVDAKRNALPDNVKIFSGDVIKCAGSVYCYESTEKVKEGGKTRTVTVRGVTLQLKAVQLIEKRNGGSNAADLFEEEEGFEAEEGGFDDETDGGVGAGAAAPSAGGDDEDF